MSRSSHHYWTICNGLDADGYCPQHGFYAYHYIPDYTQAVADLLTGSVPASISTVPRSKCRVAREWCSRRGIERRKKRYPDWCAKSFHRGSPVWLKKIWHSKYRAMCVRDMRRNEQDPELVGYNKWMSSKLWDWY